MPSARPYQVGTLPAMSKLPEAWRWRIWPRSTKIQTKSVNEEEAATKLLRFSLPLRPRAAESWNMNETQSDNMRTDPGVRRQPVSQKHTTLPEKGSPKHIFWMVPAFQVTYLKKFKPLTPRGKFDEWASGSYDPRGLALFALESGTLEHSSKDGFCGYGQGWGGYGECYGSVLLDTNISSFLGDFLFPVVMRQDPRYFRKGQGSFGSRLLYAISRVFVTHSDSGHIVFYTSALSGTFAAAAISNLYYPQQDRTFSSSLDRAALDLGNTALYNTAAEFWPDIEYKLSRLLK